ncbi:MAG: type II secretion system protein GspG [Planctomycetota bacterium]
MMLHNPDSQTQSARPRVDSKARTVASRRGFSLLELTLVLVIIGLLMGVAALGIPGWVKRASIQATIQTMDVYKTSINSFMAGNAQTPPESLSELITAGYVEPDASTGAPPKDAWDEPFYYKAGQTPEGQPYRLVSSGPDKEFGTEDDIDLWSADYNAG